LIAFVGKEAKVLDLIKIWVSKEMQKVYTDNYFIQSLLKVSDKNNLNSNEDLGYFRIWDEKHTKRLKNKSE
jgi:hypothetical protein